MRIVLIATPGTRNDALRPRTWSAVIVALLVATAAASPSYARDTVEVAPTTPSGASVQRLFDDGVAAANRRDWPKAYDCFRTAWGLVQQYQIGAQLARAEVMLGKHRDAAEHLADVLRTTTRLDGEQRALLEQMLAEAKTRIATLTIAVNRDGAEILVDGRTVDVSPRSRELYVEPGARTIEARLPGEPPARVRVELGEGQSSAVALRFDEGRAIAPRPRAPVAQSGPRSAPAAPAADDASRARAELILGLGAGVGALGAGAGITTAILSVSMASERDSRCGNAAPARCTEAEWDAIESSRATLADIAKASFVTGAIALGGTLGYAVQQGYTAQTSRPASGGSVALRVRRDGPSLVVSGKW